MMSTDTERIVNFCASFHAFWSLPFQVFISSLSVEFKNDEIIQRNDAIE